MPEVGVYDSHADLKVSTRLCHYTIEIYCWGLSLLQISLKQSYNMTYQTENCMYFYLNVAIYHDMYLAYTIISNLIFMLMNGYIYVWHLLK